MKVVSGFPFMSLVFLISSHGSSAAKVNRGLKGSRLRQGDNYRNLDLSVGPIATSHRQLNLLKKWRKKMLELGLKLGAMKNAGKGPFAPDAVLGSDFPSTAPSDVPSLAPSDVPSLRPSSAPSTEPSISPSSEPSVAPSSSPSKTPSNEPSSSPSSKPTPAPTPKPTRKPTGAPSDVPSAVPSRAPSVVPSDVPSLSPSDTPSLTPSDGPSSVPSDSPSMAPVAWGESLDNNSTQSFTADSEFCSADATTSVEGASDFTILYAYKLELVAGARVLSATRKIEELLQATLAGTVCSVDSNVVGVSPRPLDVPGAVCGPIGDRVGDGPCYFIAGRTQLLLREPLLTDSSGLYCQTLETIRQFFSDGAVPQQLSDEVVAVQSTIAGSLLPTFCNIVDRFSGIGTNSDDKNGTIVAVTKPSDEKGDTASKDKDAKGTTSNEKGAKDTSTSNEKASKDNKSVSSPTATISTIPTAPAPVAAPVTKQSKGSSSSPAVTRSEAPTSDDKKENTDKKDTQGGVGDKKQADTKEPKEEEGDETKEPEPEDDEKEPKDEAKEEPKSKEDDEEPAAAPKVAAAVDTTREVVSPSSPAKDAGSVFSVGAIVGLATAAAVLVVLVGLAIYQKAYRASDSWAADIMNLYTSSSSSGGGNGNQHANLDSQRHQQRQVNLSPRANSYGVEDFEIDDANSDREIIFSTSSVTEIVSTTHSQQARDEQPQRSVMFSP